MSERKSIDVSGVSDERLSQILMSVGQHLVVPPIGPVDLDLDLDLDVVEGRPRGHRPGAGRRRRGERRRHLALAAAAVIVVAAVIAAVPATRQAAARFLGIGSTRIELGSDPEAEADVEADRTVIDGLEPVSAAAAQAELERPLPDTSGTLLGSPHAYFLPPEGGVILAWTQAQATLWVRPGPAELDAGRLFVKLSSAGAPVQEIEGLGQAALLMTGDHVLETPDRRVKSSSVILWLADGSELRLEADLAPEELVEVARAVR